jgi:hypothetical protein
MSPMSNRLIDFSKLKEFKHIECLTRGCFSFIFMCYISDTWDNWSFDGQCYYRPICCDKCQMNYWLVSRNKRLFIVDKTSDEFDNRSVER